MNTDSLFEAWRILGRHGNESGLAWYLANQFCNRFYSSHGIVPHVIQHEGLGYYGIQLDYLHCKVNGDVQNPIGRMTMAGDVENWSTGAPGDHGLETSKMCQNGVPTEQLVTQAISHMRLPLFPVKSHLNCRHKRWGRSYELMFEITTILMIRNPSISLLNHPDHVREYVRKSDPKADMNEHLGAFVFMHSHSGKRVIVAGDGRLLDGSDINVWEDFMNGQTSFSLALTIEADINSAYD